MEDGIKSRLDNVWPNLKTALVEMYENGKILSRDELMKIHSELYNFAFVSDSELHLTEEENPITVPADTLYENIKKYLNSRTALLNHRINYDDDCINDESTLAFYASNSTTFFNCTKVIDVLWRSSLGKVWYSNFNSVWETRQNSIKYAAAKCWNDQIFNVIGENVLVAVLTLIQAERNGSKNTAREFVRQVILSLVDLGFDPEKLQMESNMPSNATSLVAWERALSEEQDRINLVMYREIFENRFLQNSVKFFIEEVEKEIVSTPPRLYLKRVHFWLQREKNMAKELFHPSTLNRWLQQFFDVVITKRSTLVSDATKDLLQNWNDALTDKHKKELMSKNSDTLEDKEKIDREILNAEKEIHKMMMEMRLIYIMCVEAGSNNTVAIANAMKEKVADIIRNDLMKAKDPQKKPPNVIARRFVNIYLQVFERFNKLVADTMENSHLVLRQIHTGIQDAFDDNPITKLQGSAEMLARYFDMLLSTKNTTIVGQELNSKLKTQLPNFVVMLSNQDFFSQSYRILLTRRLIENTMCSVERENEVLHVLHTAGCSGTLGVRLILDDGTIKSPKLNQSFQECCQTAHQMTSFDFHVMVFRSYYFPWKKEYESKTFNLPKELLSVQTLYSDFYKTHIQNDSRSLHWLMSQSHGELQASESCFESNRQYVFHCSTYQMTILLLYNWTNSISFRDIVNGTGLSKETVSSLLKNMIKSEFQLLKCEQLESEFEDSTQISLNTAFVNDNIDVFVEGRQLTDRNHLESNQIIQSKVDDALSYVLQAAAARLMKTHKSMNHGKLMGSLMDTVKKSGIDVLEGSGARHIKKAIHQLIEKEVIRRDELDNTIYHYIAELSVSALACKSHNDQNLLDEHSEQ